MAPLSPAVFTATFTFTDTPCGYPGNTCTPTFTGTPTSTFTFTDTATATNTPLPTATSTPSVMPTPQGVLGTVSSAGNPQILFLKDTNPYIAGYYFYKSTNGTTYGLLTSVATGSLPAGGYAVLTDTGAGTAFNLYYYVEEYGSLPTSPPSRVVHAVSGTTAVNGLTIAASSSTTPTISITGGAVAGAIKRVWTLVTPGGNPVEWCWGKRRLRLPA